MIKYLLFFELNLPEGDSQFALYHRFSYNDRDIANFDHYNQQKDETFEEDYVQ
jgi:hypothetical protein